MKNEIDELIKLIIKLKQQAQKHAINDEDKAFLENLNTLIDSYELIKGSITQEMLNELGNPVKELILDMVEELKQLNEPDDNTGQLYDDIQEIAMKYFGEATDNKKQSDNIQEIDNMLKNKNLSSKDIDELLDKRLKLKNKK